MRLFARHSRASPSSGDAARDGRPRPPSLARRGACVGAWLVPGTVLALLPKCPVCLAAYAALFTGASLSFEPATRLRLLLAALCVGALSCLALRMAQRWVAPRRLRAQR